jgi:predicted HAD superfamily Cof-like phosphohydrolase
MLLQYLLPVPLLLILLAGCSGIATHQNVNNDEQVQKSATEISEDQLLDVWIELFEPGALPDDTEKASGLSEEIREAEARYMPLQLRDTMEKTGYWGAVRVVPQGTEGGEVLVRGSILVSDGENLELAITALDASGREWFSSTYEAEVSMEAYRSAGRSGQDVFQALYNAIANDLAAHRATLTAEDIITVRRVAALHFAADLAPDAFADHIQRSEEGHFAVTRLPALDDPMYRRVNAIRERDFLLIDTLNGHFDNFYHEMQDPYEQWRKTRVEELAALREIQRQARNRKLMGAAAILGAIAIEALGGDSTRASTGSLRNVMIVGGAYAIKTGFDKDSETTIHREAIEELGESFSSETRPLVVEVEGETHELTGSAEVQYSKWRALLKSIYVSETGLTEVAD